MSDYLAVLPLADVKAFLNLETTQTEPDAWLEREIKSQLQVIENYLDSPVVVRHIREDRDGTGDDSLDLDATPVQSVVDLRFDDDRRFGAETRIQPSEYTVDDDCIDLLYDTFPRGRRNIRVQYIAGYAEIEIPFSRIRFDIREAAGGELLTAHLPTGKWKPTELAETLEYELNMLGEYDRTVTFDWTHRRYVIKQPESDYLQVVTHVSNQFTSTVSATGLLGFSSNTELTDGQILGAAVTFGIPEVITTVALELIAIHYSQSAFGRNHYGIQSYWLDDYRVIYDTSSEESSEDGAGIPPRLKNRLKPFKRWDLF